MFHNQVDIMGTSFFKTQDTLNPTTIYKIALCLAAACLMTFVILIAIGITGWSGPFLIAFFIALAISKV